MEEKKYCIITQVLDQLTQKLYAPEYEYYDTYGEASFHYTSKIVDIMDKGALPIEDEDLKDNKILSFSDRRHLITLVFEGEVPEDEK